MCTQTLDTGVGLLELNSSAAARGVTSLIISLQIRHLCSAISAFMNELNTRLKGQNLDQTIAWQLTKIGDTQTCDTSDRVL